MGEPDINLDGTDRWLLDAIQSEFPLGERPYRSLGERLGISENEVMDRIRRHRGSGLIRQISAIFDSAALGYRSALFAFQVGQSEIEAAAEIVNAHPGVSHNYERGHAFNLWFTLTAPPPSDPRAHGAALAALARVERWLYLPAIRLFKIGVYLPMSASGPSDEAANPRRAALGALRDGTEENPEAGSVPGGEAREAPVREEAGTMGIPLRAERQAVLALQEDLPLEIEPFRHRAEEFGLSPTHLLDLAQKLLQSGKMRRFAAILRHQRAGRRHNVMSVWEVPESRAEEAGAAMARFREVSHCYQRPTSPGWPWSHYAMIHARSEDEGLGVVRGIADATGLDRYELLPTVREFKKVRIRYFTGGIAKWEAQHVSRAMSGKLGPER
ncbi:MAG TPA: AsnC family transcriptional regulator [Sumerlaeia bacterium]|nr:AsnC family transcriptional regulator [Sumerlaeia bacterium]